MFTATAKIKALTGSTHGSWFTKTNVDAIGWVLQDFWNDRYDRWNAPLDKDIQEAAITHLVRVRDMEPKAADRVITAWKSSKKYLRPGNEQYTPHNTSTATDALAKDIGYNVDKAEAAHRKKCVEKDVVDTVVSLLIQNFDKMLEQDPLLAHNMRILFITLVCTRTLGLRPQQTCAPREGHKVKSPQVWAEFQDWIKGDIKGNIRRSYVSIWNCKENEIANYHGPNPHIKYCKYWRRRCKRRPKDICDSRIWVLRDLFEYEKGRPFHKGIFEYMEEAHASMVEWAQTYPKMKKHLDEETWAIFVNKGGRSKKFKVRRYQQGDPAKLFMDAQMWLAANIGWEVVPGLELYNLRHKRAIQSFCASRMISFS